jgi:hypothetical protein
LIVPVFCEGQKINTVRPPVSTDSVTAVYHGLKKNLKIKEINGS